MPRFNDGLQLGTGFNDFKPTTKNRVPLESSLQRRVIKYARDRGLLCVKHESMHSAGQPDYEIYMPGGKPILIEFKRPGGQLTPNQKNRIAFLRGIEYVVYVVSDPVEGEKIIQDAILKIAFGKPAVDTAASANARAKKAAHQVERRSLARSGRR